MEKTMKLLINQAKNEEGAALIVALLMLIFLTLLGIWGTTTTIIELQISGNEKFHKMAFYHADSGVYAAPKLVSKCIDTGGEVPVGADDTIAPDMVYLTDQTAFYRQVMGYADYDGGTPDITFTLGNFDVEVDVNRTGTKTLAGGGAEFGSGAEGIGVGSTGALAIFYDMNSFGSGPANSISNVSAAYRKVVGIAGGL